jgi:hypothetical protein
MKKSSKDDKSSVPQYEQVASDRVSPFPRKPNEAEFRTFAQQKTIAVETRQRFGGINLRKGNQGTATDAKETK